MAVNTITFGGVNSADYGIYISGEGVFNAPVRDTEMVSIPGRNGSFLLDNGRFENIKVTYPAFNVEPDMESFVSRVDAFRNAIVSKKGYQRLTDTFHPDEYRLATFIDGFEMEPVKYNTAGRFELSFDCKPQRFLFSGEEVFTLGEWGQTETKSGSIVSFEGDETTAIKSLTAQIVPKQSGSGDPSPSNVKTISGYSEVNVNVSGKNLSPLPTKKGYWTASNGNFVSDSTWASTEKFRVKGGNTYRVSTSFANRWCGVIAYDSGGTFIGSIGEQASHTGRATDISITTPSNCYYIGISLANPTQTAIDLSTITDLQVEVGNVKTSYEPTESTTYPISLGQTVYGGTLDVVSGELSNIWALLDLGSQNWQGSNGLFYISNFLAYVIPNDYNYMAEARCSSFKLGTRQELYSSANDNTFSIHKTNVTYLSVRCNAYTTASEFKSAVNGVMLAYRPLTSTEIQLTPTEVKTLLGSNNIWADSGDVTVEIGQNPNVLFNPTLFEACPLIEFNSSGEDGEINLGSRQIKVLSAILGRINLGLDVSGSKTTTRTWQDVITVQNAGSFNAGDILRFNGGKVIFTFNFTPINVEVVSQETDLKASWQRGSNNLELSLNNLEFPAGTDTTDQFTCDIKVKASLTPSIEGTETFTVTTSYNRNGVLTITWAGGNYSFGEYTYIQGASNYTGYGDSTKNSLEDVDIYVDLDIGEAYSIDSDDNVVSLNNFVNLGGELPTLEPGATEITTDDSISNVKVTPRWWKV